MNTVEILKAARELISDPDRFTQGAFTRDKKGRITAACSPDAIRWCAFGALIRVAETGNCVVPSFEALKQQRKAIAVLARHASEDVNLHSDTHTHAEVLALFDKAIADLEGAKS